MRGSSARAWIVWAALLALVTIVMRLWRPDLDQAHVVLAYLLVVLGGSVAGGRALGFTMACAGFLLIDYFFQIPIRHLLHRQQVVGLAGAGILSGHSGDGDATAGPCPGAGGGRTAPCR